VLNTRVANVPVSGVIAVCTATIWLFAVLRPISA